MNSGMFTGIVDHVGQVSQVSPSQNGMTLRIQSEFKDFALGESISVDGACLTVMDFKGGNFDVELSPETLKLTTAHSYGTGSSVNLERAMRMGDRFGGHWVTGHVEGTVALKSATQLAEFKELVFEGVSASLIGYLSKKGSVTLNGVSLTVNEVLPGGFSVMLIPHTLERTNLSRLTAGDLVNVEYDWMTRVIVGEVRNFLSQGKSSL